MALFKKQRITGRFCRECIFRETQVLSDPEVCQKLQSESIPGDRFLQLAIFKTFKQSQVSSLKASSNSKYLSSNLYAIPSIWLQSFKQTQVSVFKALSKPKHL